MELNVTKADWIAALRSGEYEQGLGALTPDRGKTFCCIGVLGCLVNGEKSYRGAYGRNTDEYDWHTYRYTKPFGAGKEGYEYAQQLIGLDCSSRVQSMNDAGNTFAEIADFLETI